MTNKSAGVMVAINTTIVRASQITMRWDPPYDLAGRLGAVRIKTGSLPDDADLYIAAVYAPQEKEDYRECFWEEVSRMLAKAPARAQVVVTADANGHVMASGTHVAGDLHEKDETVNGTSIKQMAAAAGLTLVNTWAAECKGGPDEWEEARPTGRLRAGRP